MNLQQAKDYYLEFYGKESSKDCVWYSKDFENKYGVSGISKDYKFPSDDYQIVFFNKFFPYYDAIKNDVSKVPNLYNQKRLLAQNAILDSFIECDILNGINIEFNRLKKLNPEMKKLRYDRLNFVKSFETILGVCAGLNIDDINHFVYASQKNKDKLYKEQQEFEKENNIKFDWILSTKTLSKVRILLNKKNERQLQDQKKKNHKSVMVDEEEFTTKFGVMAHKYID